MVHSGKWYHLFAAPTKQGQLEEKLPVSLETGCYSIISVKCFEFLEFHVSKIQFFHYRNAFSKTKYSRRQYILMEEHRLWSQNGPPPFTGCELEQVTSVLRLNVLFPKMS